MGPGHDIPNRGLPQATGPNEAHRIDTAADGHPIIGVYADYQAAIPSSQVILLLEVTGSRVKVRAFNTSTGKEQFSTAYVNNSGGTQFSYFPYVLPWGQW